MHSRELAVAQHDAHAAKQAITELRRAEAAGKGRGRLARVLAAWGGITMPAADATQPWKVRGFFFPVSQVGAGPRRIVGRWCRPRSSGISRPPPSRSIARNRWRPWIRGRLHGLVSRLHGDGGGRADVAAALMIWTTRPRKRACLSSPLLGPRRAIGRSPIGGSSTSSSKTGVTLMLRR